MPQILSDEVMLCGFDIPSNLSSKSYLLPRVITGDKTWCFQCICSSSPHPKKGRISRSQLQDHADVFLG